MGGRVNSVLARQASTGELLSPRHVHKPSKHKPAYFFLLNPEVILRPDPHSHNSGFFPVRISTKSRKAGGSLLFFSSMAQSFTLSRPRFIPTCHYSSLSPPEPQTLPPNTQQERLSQCKNQHQRFPNLGPGDFKGTLTKFQWVFSKRKKFG